MLAKTTILSRLHYILINYVVNLNSPAVGSCVVCTGASASANGAGAAI